MLTMVVSLTSEYQASIAPRQLETLLVEMAAGDRESLAELYHRTRTAVYGLALSIVKNAADAEDVTQDTFVRAWEKAEQYTPQGTPMGWLLAIARNLSRMKLRERDKSRELSEEEWLAIPMEAPELTSEDRAVLQAALTALDDQERQVVMLHAVTGLKHREVARLLELPLPTVLSKYSRAIRKLKVKLKGEWIS